MSVSLWPRTNSTVSATKSTARIHVVADLLPKPATKLNVYGSRLCCRFVSANIVDKGQSNFNKIHRVEFNFVAVYRALECRGNYSATSNNMKLVHWPLMGGLLQEGTGRAAAPPIPLLAVPNVTAHPSTAGVPITVLCITVRKGLN